MKLIFKYLLVSFILILTCSSLFARPAENNGSADKKLDLVKYHNVGNIWLRVSNYGFFGSGDDISPRWPSLEYPGGSAIDYLYQGALWFGAKKQRRNTLGEKLYWLEDAGDPNDYIPESHPDWQASLAPVIDTLVTVGFDGDADVYEFLPAYNPKENVALGTQYSQYNTLDKIMYTSIREHRKGVDDDGDGLIDEDPIGYSFPFRDPDELPEVFSQFGNRWLHELDADDAGTITDYEYIWFPLGFVNLGYEDPLDDYFSKYILTEEYDDDYDGLYDEDGYPVSEQDFVSYYYDYSPFNTAGNRSWGGSSNTHEPLNVRVRQLSYQWSFEHIKNLCYVEFDITNMNSVDILYDCTMGVYMDSDVGPQAWTEVYTDDVSSFVEGENYDFAYTFDWDGDGGLTTGKVGSRVCTPDPEELVFACWTWGEDGYCGPEDADPLNTFPGDTSKLTANEKYWLLTGRNPEPDDFTSLLISPEHQFGNPGDTRYLFAFYGDMQGMTSPTDGSWNLAPGKTMKIVIAIFPGDDLEDLKQSARWAKDIYGQAQTLTTVVLPDTFIHYVGPEPPAIPNMFAELVDNGNAIDVYWDNKSEIDNIDTEVVNTAVMGWQNINPGLDSYIDNYDANIYPTDNPVIYPPDPLNYNDNALVNPWTGFRMRHDFQGYSLWGRSGSGSQEDWIQKQKWAKVDTEQDKEDYNVNADQDTFFFDFGGDIHNDDGLPDMDFATEEDTDYYHFNSFYKLVQYAVGDTIYGKAIYNYAVDYSDSLQQYAYSLSFDEQALLFKHPALRDDIYLEIYDDKLIPLVEHGAQANIGNPDNLEVLRKDRLARRYYSHKIMHPPKGIEYYVAATSWDRGMPEVDLQPLESGRDADANMKIIFPGPTAKSKMDNIYVVPNPYIGHSKFDGRREKDEKGDKSRRIWFVNLPERCKIKVFTLAGDLVDEFDHEGQEYQDVISVSKASYSGLSASGMEPWDLLSMYNQIIAPGVYLFSVKDKDSGEIKVGKFVIIK